MKSCFKCSKVLPLSSFYKHKMMADGHLNKCKECAKKDVRTGYYSDVEASRARERQRGTRTTAEVTAKYRKKNPEKYRAHCMVRTALKNKILVKNPCEVCGSKQRINAHHDDYSKPLEVMWLCSVHHHARHRELDKTTGKR